jgi:hypothetical protein
MSLFLEICVSLAMIGIALYTGALAVIAILANKTKVEMTKAREEQFPPAFTGEDLL